MILRVYRASAAAEDRGLLLAHLRDHVYPANIGQAGLRTFQAGLRELPGQALELAIVSTWSDVGSLMQGLGGDVLRPSWLEAVRERLTPIAADHYELVGEELQGIVPLAGGALRIFRGRLRSDGGETFFESARRWQAEQLDSGIILVSHLGRRILADGEEAVYVTVWRDSDAPREAGGTEDEPANQGLWGRFFSDWSFGAYDAIARVPGRRDAANALLLADDDGRYVFASPAAGALLGLAPARLLGRRVHEVTAPALRDAVPTLWTEFLERGQDSAAFELQRADGAVVPVRYVARAHTPWPGVHASVLGAPDAALDLDEELAAAGIIARYEMAVAAGD